MLNNVLSSDKCSLSCTYGLQRMLLDQILRTILLFFKISWQKILQISLLNHTVILTEQLNLGHSIVDGTSVWQRNPSSLQSCIQNSTKLTHTLINKNVQVQPQWLLQHKLGLVIYSTHFLDFSYSTFLSFFFVNFFLCWLSAVDCTGYPSAF